MLKETTHLCGLKQAQHVKISQFVQRLKSALYQAEEILKMCLAIDMLVDVVVEKFNNLNRILRKTINQDRPQ